jgi:hypothetical protein
MLTPLMQAYLKKEIELHDGCHEISLCVHLMIVAAFFQAEEYGELTEELHNECRIFILDEIMASCILKGALEVAGMNEDGEMTFGVTEWGKAQVEAKDSSHGARQQDGEEERYEG